MLPLQEHYIYGNIIALTAPLFMDYQGGYAALNKTGSLARHQQTLTFNKVGHHLEGFSTDIFL
jgi:hypothetical protein